MELVTSVYQDKHRNQYIEVCHDGYKYLLKPSQFSNPKSIANLSPIKKGEKRAEKPENERKTERLVIMATKEERARIEREALESKQNMSSYMRGKLNL